MTHTKNKNCHSKNLRTGILSSFVKAVICKIEQISKGNPLSE